MKILHLTNYYPPFYEGSAEIQCQQLVEQIGELGGREQQVLTSDFVPAEKQSGASDVWRQLQIADRNAGQKNVFRELKLHDTNGQQPFWKLFRHERDNVEVFQRRVDAFNPDLIFIWGFQGLSGSLLFNLENSGIPCVYGVLNKWLTLWLKKEPWLDMWYHDSRVNESVFKNLIEGMHLSEPIRRKAPFGDPRTLALQNCFFCSKSLKQGTRRDGFAVDQAEIIPCGVPVEKFYRKENYPAQLRHLLYLGRLNADKDPLTAVQALEILHRAGHTEFTLDIHGHGDPAYEAKLRDAIVRSNLRGAVSFRGTSEEQQHVTLYSYDMLLATSRWDEPFPLMQLKAMAAGLPVISTLEGGHVELIRDGENALAFKTSHPEDLAEKILELSHNSALVKKLTTNAYEEVSTRFSLKHVAAQVDAFIGKALHPATESSA